MKKITIFMLCSFLLLPQMVFSKDLKSLPAKKSVVPIVRDEKAVPSDEAKIFSVKGVADIKSADTDIWYAAQNGTKLKTGQKIKTKARSRVKRSLPDGSKIEIYPNSNIDLKNMKAQHPALKVLAGRIKAWVTRNVKRDRFEVHTPVAVCSVRGTEFTVDVDESGQTEVEVTQGLVGVRKGDMTGEEIPVGAGEKIDITGNEQVLSPDQKSEAMSDQKMVRRELGLEMTKEEVQSAAAAEMRLAEYQEGKTMIDVSGARVRLEEYIMRPAADQFKLVVLNERDNRFDYFYYKGTFNKDLPADLSTALNSLSGTLGSTAPDYYLLSYEKAYSNTADYSKDSASGGHLVRITYNADGTFTLTDPGSPTNTRTVNAYDTANGAYDPISDTFDTTKTSALDLTVYNTSTDAFDTFKAGDTFFNTRFNSYEHNINGTKKQWYFTTNTAKNMLVSDLDGHLVYPAADSSGNTIYGDWGALSATSSYPDSNTLHNRIKVTYLDNTYEQYDNYIISDDGKIASASEFNGVTTGTAYKEKLLNWNYEQVITASEFGSRKIDLVIEPKILIKSGIIK